MKNRRPLTLLFCLFLCLTLVGCDLYAPEYPSDSSTDTETPEEENGVISFEGRRFSYTGNGEDISYKNDTLLIKAPGIYRLTGELTEGRIAISCSDGEAVRLLLDGVKISSTYGSPIWGDTPIILEALADTVNIFSVSDYKNEDSTFPTACIYSRSSLTLCGEGLTIINSDGDSALLSLTRLYVKSGRVNVKAKKYGVWARDEFALGGGRLTVSYAPIGIFCPVSENSEGSIEIFGGTLTAACAEAVLSARVIRITGGDASLDAPIFYKCENDKIHISSDGFPKYEKPE